MTSAVHFDLFLGTNSCAFLAKRKKSCAMAMKFARVLTAFAVVTLLLVAVNAGRKGKSYKCVF